MVSVLRSYLLCSLNDILLFLSPIVLDSNRTQIYLSARDITLGPDRICYFYNITHGLFIQIPLTTLCQPDDTKVGGIWADWDRPQIDRSMQGHAKTHYTWPTHTHPPARTFACMAVAFRSRSRGVCHCQPLTYYGGRGAHQLQTLSQHQSLRIVLNQAVDMLNSKHSIL